MSSNDARNIALGSFHNWGMTEGLSRKAAAEFFSSANYVSGNGLLCICQNMGKRNLEWRVTKWFYKMRITSTYLLLKHVALLAVKTSLSVSLQNTVSNFGLVPIVLVSHY
jgi:hypothetical protein